MRSATVEKLSLAAVLSKALGLIRLRGVTFATREISSTCPKCGTQGLRRSHVRFYERFRKSLSANRPFRCNRCGGRVWGCLASDKATPEPCKPVVVHEPLDLSALDAF